MERRINSRIDAFMHAFKLQIAAQFEEVRQKNAQNVAANPQLQDMQRDYTQVMNFIYETDKLKLSKDDFAKRKRVKNAVPVFDRCHAKRANGEQCTRRKRKGVCAAARTRKEPRTECLTGLTSPSPTLKWKHGFKTSRASCITLTIRATCMIRKTLLPTK